MANSHKQVRFRVSKMVAKARSYWATGHRVNVITLPNQTVLNLSALLKSGLQLPGVTYEMTKKKKSRSKRTIKAQARFRPDKALVKTGIYAVEEPKSQKKEAEEAERLNAIETKASRIAMEKGKKMAKIEAYAKEHRITITQAMIHFM